MHDAPYDDDDLEFSTDGRDLSDALHLPTENRVFYHGTSKRNARRILREGLKDWSWTESTPKIKYKAEEGATRWLVCRGQSGAPRRRRGMILRAASGADRALSMG